MIWDDELGFDFFTSILDPDISSMTAPYSSRPSKHHAAPHVSGETADRSPGTGQPMAASWGYLSGLFCCLEAT